MIDHAANPSSRSYVLINNTTTIFMHDDINLLYDDTMIVDTNLLVECCINLSSH